MIFPVIETMVRDRIGLDAAAIGTDAFARAVGERMRIRGTTTAEAYAGLLATEPTEWTALTDLLVVPETWFFRGGADYFRYLARWAKKRSSDRPARVLCIPCSTGEEPYSLALALEEEGVPLAACHIDGVDLCAESVRRAQEARYPDFSFREAGNDPRPEYFRELPDGKWELTERPRRRVHFRVGNLVASDFLAGEAAYDLILCRNLLIYLSAGGRTRALANLNRLLAPEGLLGLTATEADHLPPGYYVPTGPLALALFHRAKTPPVVPTHHSARYHSPVPTVKREPARLEPFSLAAPVSGSGAAEVFNVPRAIRELADTGRLEDACAACERAIATDPTADLFELLGAIHLAAGRPDAALDAFRKAVYLDPNHTDALAHLAALCDRRGDTERANRYRSRLARLEREAQL